MMRDPTQMEEETCMQILEGLSKLAGKHRATTSIMTAVNLAAISISAQLVYDLTNEQREQLHELLAQAIHDTTTTFLRIMK